MKDERENTKDGEPNRTDENMAEKLDDSSPNKVGEQYPSRKALIPIVFSVCLASFLASLVSLHSVLQ